MKAIEQNLVDRRADLILRRLDQPEPQVATGILDVVKVARDFAGRREDHDPAGMDELVLLRVETIAETDGIGQGANRVGLSGEKMPAARRAGAAVSSK